MEVEAREWLERFAASLGVEPPSESDVESLLALAGVAAHASERTAAPLSTWLVGRAGVSSEEAGAAAVRLAAVLGTDEAGSSRAPA